MLAIVIYFFTYIKHSQYPFIASPSIITCNVVHKSQLHYTRNSNHMNGNSTVHGCFTVLVDQLIQEVPSCVAIIYNPRWYHKGNQTF